ncbi:hypothetical protein NK662_23085, partial [Ectobacillus sp. SYSU M60031]|nr:hypothetical protein [Ectobacillus ponti]
HRDPLTRTSNLSRLRNKRLHLDLSNSYFSVASNNWFLPGITTIDNAVDRGGCQLGLLLLHYGAMNRCTDVEIRNALRLLAPKPTEDMSRLHQAYDRG